MNYDKAHSKSFNNNRTLSLRGLNSSLSFLDPSKPKINGDDSYFRVADHLARDSPFKNTVSAQNPLRQILSPQAFSLNSNSPFQARVSVPKVSSSISMTARSSRNGHDRAKSAIIDKENEYESTLAFAVQAALGMQKEKERETGSKKVAIENSISEQENLINDTTLRLTSHKETTQRCYKLLIGTLSHLEEIIQNPKANIAAESNLLSWLEVSDEILKDFFGADRGLKGHLMKLLSHHEKDSSSKVLRKDKEELEKSTEQISALVYKLNDAEEKLRQVIESGYMAEEDIDSHVVMATESIFMHEEVSDMIDELSRKNPTEFNHVKRELALEEKLNESIIIMEEENIFFEQQTVALEVDYENLATSEERLNTVSKEAETLSNRLSLSEGQMVEGSGNIAVKLVQTLRQLKINDKEIQRIVEYACVLISLGELGDSNKGLWIEFQAQILEEVVYTLKQGQVIDGLETKLAAANNKKTNGLNSSRSYEVFDSNNQVQGSLISEKLELNDKLLTYKTKRRECLEILKQNFPSKSTLLLRYEMPFFNVANEILNKLDYSIRSKARQAIVDIVNRFKAALKAYVTDNKAVRVKAAEYKELQQLTDELKLKIEDKDAVLQKRKEDILAREEEIRGLAAEIKAIQDIYAGAEDDNEEPKTLRIAEKLLERECIQTRRGDSLVRLKNDFSKAVSKTKEYKKIKAQLMNVEAQLLDIEDYRTKISQKIEQELRPNVKKFKSQRSEFTMKINLIQKEVLIALQKKLVSLRELEASLYALLDSNKGVEDSIINKALDDILTCKECINELLSKLREQIIAKLSSRINEMTCLDADLVKTMQKQIELELKNLLGDDGHLLSIERQLVNQREALKTKRTKLLDIDNEVDKYKAFYEASSELLKEKVQTSRDHGNHLSMSLLSARRDAPIHKKNTQSSIPCLPLQIKNSNVPENRYVIDSLYSSKVDKADDQELDTHKASSEAEMESEPASLTSSSTKTRSTSRNFQSMSFKSNYSDRLLNQESVAVSETKRLSVTRQGGVPKSLSVPDEELRSLINQFELGFPIYKRFADSNKVEEKISITLSIKGRSKAKKDLRGYGKRILRLNIKDKSIDVVKVGTSGSRSAVEYRYDWTSVKQVMIPQKTMQSLKGLREAELEMGRSIESGNVEASFSNPQAFNSEKDAEEGNFDLKLSMDVTNKGRIDFLMDKGSHVVALWNAVHIIATQSSLLFFMGR